jgi:hypothetical protein
MIIIPIICSIKARNEIWIYICRSAGSWIHGRSKGGNNLVFISCSKRSTPTYVFVYSLLTPLLSLQSKLSPIVLTGSAADEEVVNAKGPACIVSNAAAATDKIKGFSAVLGGTLAHLALGTLYTWGNLLSYSPKSLRFFDGGDYNGKQPDALGIIPLILISQCTTMPLGSLVTQKLGAANAMRIGGLIAASGVFLASYVTRLVPFMFLYGMLFGFGAGIGYTAPMAAGWKWLPDQKGLVSGIILTGFGAGGFVFNIIGTKLMNPKSLEASGGAARGHQTLILEAWVIRVRLGWPCTRVA